jgi:PAS domain S-box-containing protein
MTDDMTTKVLLVDDDEDDYLLASDYLREIPNRNFHADWSPGFEDALSKIKDRSYDIYIFDFLLGAKTGLDLLHEAIRLGCEEPIILLTGKGDQRVDEEAMKLGAVDYLVKGELNAESLERSIRYALDRSNSLKALRESERKFRTIFEQSADVIFLCSLDFSFLQLNPSASQLLGHDMDSLYQMSLNDLWELRDIHTELEDKLRKEEAIKDWEITILTKERERRFCLLSISHQQDIRNQPYLQGMLHDITNRKKAERDLLLAEKLATAARLARTLAHEVRNPLTNINLALEELEESLASQPETLSYLGIIQRSSQRINDLINELLSSSRPSELHLTEEHMAQLLEETLELAQDRIQLKNIQVHKDFQKAWQLRLKVDGEKLKIAFLNIVINAIEAMSEQGLLSVKLYVQAKDCVVEIADNGSGISPQNLNRLFEPYFTSKVNGMGLGLAATLNIVQSNHGRIEVDSELGKGTRFTLFFNLSNAPEKPENGFSA